MEKKTILDLQRISVDEFRRSAKAPLVVVLDNVRSMNNVGSIFRTSDAFRVSELLLCGITPTPPSPEIHKTALGAEDSVAWRHYDDTLQAIADLKQQGYTVMALEQAHGATMLNEFVPVAGAKYAIIAGHEVEGVSAEAVNAADGCLEIPQFGTKHSLNVSVSTALAIWHFVFP